MLVIIVQVTVIIGSLGALHRLVIIVHVTVIIGSLGALHMLVIIVQVTVIIGSWEPYIGYGYNSTNHSNK